MLIFSFKKTYIISFGVRSTMIGVFIFALQVFGLICGYAHQTSLKTTSNFSLHDSFLPANLELIFEL